jgi:hypothetical protein
VETADPSKDQADRATDDIFDCVTKNSTRKSFEERRNAQILKPVLDDASTARRQSYRVK